MKNQKKVNFFNEVKIISRANQLTKKVDINTEAFFGEIKKSSSSKLDDIYQECSLLSKKLDIELKKRFGYAKNVIQLELLLNQMNINNLFDAIKDASNDDELKQQLEEDILEFKEGTQKEALTLCNL